MKGLNKKGFTLIELLAVIIVLAVVTLLAVQSVLPQVEKARKNAFITEVNNTIEAGKQWYADMLLTNPSKVSADKVCVQLAVLKKGYYEAPSDNYKGYVEIVKSSTGSVTYNIKLTNGAYQTATNKTAGEHVGKILTSDAATAVVAIDSTSSYTVSTAKDGTTCLSS